MRSRWTFQPSNPAEQLRAASDALEGLLTARGVSERGRFAARLVAEEIVLNAFEHGGARSVIMEADPSEDPLRLDFEDDGASFDPSVHGKRVRTGVAARGRGLVLVRAFTRSIEHVRAGERNRTRVRLVD